MPRRPSFTAKYPDVTAEKLAAFVSKIETLSVRIADPPSAFVLPRDPGDEPFFNLAIAGTAGYLVTWNERHLTYLIKQDTSEGREFCQRFPKIKILSPVQFLGELRSLRP